MYFKIITDNAKMVKYNSYYFLSLFVFLFLFMAVGIDFVSSFSGYGDGSSENPYEVTDCIQLQGICALLKIRGFMMLI